MTTAIQVRTWGNDDGSRWYEITAADRNEPKLLLTEAEFVDMWRVMSSHVEAIHERERVAEAATEKVMREARRKAAQRIEDHGGRRWVIQRHPEPMFTHDIHAWIDGYEPHTSPARVKAVDYDAETRSCMYVVEMRWDEITRAANPDSPHTHYTLSSDHRPRRFKAIGSAIGMAMVELRRLQPA